MTNEEFTEEIYYEAHLNGFIDELRVEINRLKTNLNTHKLPTHELVHKAYHNVVSTNDNN